MKRDFKDEINRTFHHFQRVLLKQIKHFFFESESPTLSVTYIIKSLLNRLTRFLYIFYISYYFWMKKENNFQLAKVQPQSVAQLLLDFFFANFGWRCLYKVLLIKKSVQCTFKAKHYCNSSDLKGILLIFKTDWHLNSLKVQKQQFIEMIVA